MAYDEEYLDSGCTLPYDPETNFDGSAWTYGTDYVIWIQGVLIAWILFRTQGWTTSANQGFIPLYFLLHSTSYGIGGINHHVSERRDDPTYQPLYITSIVFNIYGSLFLLGIPLSNIVFRGHKLYTYCTIVLGGILLCVLGSVTDTLDFVASGVTMISQFINGLLWGRDAACSTSREQGARLWNAIKVLSVILYFLGGAYFFLVYESTCGYGGYESCFEECTMFSNPVAFNHLAVFHILLIAAFGFHGTAEYFEPTRMSWSSPSEEDHGDSQQKNLPSNATDQPKTSSPQENSEDSDPIFDS